MRQCGRKSRRACVRGLVGRLCLQLVPAAHVMTGLVSLHLLGQRCQDVCVMALCGKEVIRLRCTGPLVQYRPHCTHTHAHTHRHARTYVCTHARTHTHARMHAHAPHTYACTHAHTHAPARTHKHARTHMHTLLLNVGH